MTQSEQTEAFPRTTLEILEQLRGVHASQLEKAIDALDALCDDEKIARRYDKAEEKVAGCRELLRSIDRALEELRGMDVEHHVSEMKRHAEEAGTTVTLTAGGQSVTFGAAVDPITGEVENACVVAVYPASNSFDEEPAATPVGQFTRYGELVADYGTACGVDVTMGEWQVVGEDDGKARDLGAPIAKADHGKRLLVQRVPAAKPEEAVA